MMLTLSLAIVTMLGLIITALSLWGIFVPQRLLGFVSQVMNHRYGIWIAVFVRLLLGAALIITGPASAYPTAFMVLGWIAVLAALGLAMMGPARLRAFVAFFGQLPPLLVRVLLLAGAAFGVFLVNGVLTGAAPPV